MNLWPSDAFSFVADVCSIGSLFLTGLITVTAAKVRRQYLDKILFPAYLQTLENHCLNLEEYLLEYAASSVPILREIGQIEGSLHTLRPELKRQNELTAVDTAMQSVKNYNNLRTEASLRDVYTQMNRLAREMQNKVLGLQWGA